MRRPLLATAIAMALLVAIALPAGGQELTTCPEYEGIACDGWVTDAAGILADEPALENQVDDLVVETGSQIAVVVVSDTGGTNPRTFGLDLFNTWGIGDAERNDGVLVLVALAERRTEIIVGTALPSQGTDDVAEAGNSFFGNGDFDGGLAAIVFDLGIWLDGVASGDITDSPPGFSPVFSPDISPDDGIGFPLGTLAVLGVGAGVIGITAIGSSRRSAARRIRRKRSDLVDTELEALDVAGHELPRLADYSHPLPATDAASGTGVAIEALYRLSDRTGVPRDDDLLALWANGLVNMVDAQRLLADTEVPLELRVSEEQEILEETVQTVARDAIHVRDEDEFQVALGELRRLVAAVRPYRVAGARRRAGIAIAGGAVATGFGDAVITDLGARFLRAGVVLDPDAPVAISLTDLEGAYGEARQKTGALERIYDRLPTSSARPAVAAALADVEEDPDVAVERYEQLRVKLETEGDALQRDGLSIPAIAALLLMNKDETEVGQFISAYRTIRRRGFKPDEAVEYALAGLRTRDEIDQVRAEASRLGLPVSITAALLRRRDDGPEVYRGLVAELVAQGITGETNKTIAGILAISLEPSQAVRRWLEARKALTALGLTGAYADIAAAFGASDPRGPQRFALAYAATRQALARSKIDDADRFAPELAHDGTRRQTDTWTGSPLPHDLRSFDPFTLLFYHWVITKGHSGATGWEPVYRDSSWSSDRSSWWGGFGGGSSSGGGGGSSWGGSSWGGSFGGGFGGGGSIGGGGGSGW